MAALPNVITFPSRTQRTDLTFLEKATALNLQLGSLSLTKKMPKGSVTTETGADGSTTNPDRVRASKKLMQCKEVQEIQAAQSNLRRWIYSRTLPSPFRAGILLIPNTLLGEVDAELSMGAQTIARLGEALLSVYERIITEEEAALGPNFNRADYDTPDAIRARLTVQWSYVVFGVPQNLPSNLYTREQDKARAKLAEATDTIQQVLRAEMADLVKHAVERLTGSKDDGKPKTFKNTLVENIREFLAVFRDRNITDDKELDILCDQARRLLDGVNPQDLRDKEPLRQSVARGFEDIKTKLDTMLVPAGARAISFEDEV